MSLLEIEYCIIAFNYILHFTLHSSQYNYNYIPLLRFNIFPYFTTISLQHQTFEE